MRKIFFIAFVFISLSAFAQNDRITDNNNTNWIQVFSTFKINNNWSLHTEYQWRREHGFKNWQQSLLRLGVNRKLNDQVVVHAGYAWIESFRYGDFPTAAGTVPEHRIYEQISFRESIKKWVLTHRFRIEQRWQGRLQNGSSHKIDSWVYVNRFRYQFKAQINLSEKWYAFMSDEIYIGAGKNVGINIFDQNRIFINAGYKINKKVSVETGFFNQTIQQGKRINNNTIIQSNNGVVAALNLSL